MVVEDIAKIVIYNNEKFVLGDTKDDKGLLWTHIYEKAVRNNFEKGNIAYDKWVKLSEIEAIKIYQAKDNKYRVKYQNHFFLVSDETKDMVQIQLIGDVSSIADTYFMIYDSYNGTATKWVPREETTPIGQITNERLALYKSFVCIILDEKEGEVKLSNNLRVFRNFGWEEIDDTFQKWVTKNEVFIYAEATEPLRY